MVNHVSKNQMTCVMHARTEILTFVEVKGQHLCYCMHYTVHYTGKMLNHCTIVHFVCFVFAPLSRKQIDMIRFFRVQATSMFYPSCSLVCF